MADRFVAGDRLEDAVETLGHLQTRGIGGILDHLGENVTDEHQAARASEAYLACLERIRNTSYDAHISVKLTQLGMDLSMERCIAHMREICKAAEDLPTFVAIDMESHRYTDPTIEVYRELRASHDNVILCLQAYLKRTASDIESLLPLAPRIRLCKGAYDEPKAISLGRRATRGAFVHALKLLTSASPMTAVATHDDRLIEIAKSLSTETGADLEFQMLYGVREHLQQQLVKDGHRVRVYIPFGEEWYPYLMRRLAERPANLRFFLESTIRR